MTVNLADGVRGIEARHKWINTATSTLLATLGDHQEWPDDEDRIWPHTKIRDIAGLFDLPEIEDNFEAKTEAVGLVPYPSRARGKTVTYTVDVRGRTLQEMREGAAALRIAFGPDVNTGLAVERLMIVSPHPTYGTPEHAFKARCLQFVQGADAQVRGPSAVPTPYQRSIVIGLRMYDPRVYEYDSESELGIENPKW